MPHQALENFWQFFSELGGVVYGITRKKQRNQKYKNIVCDVNKTKKIKAIIKKIYLKEKKIDVLINNMNYL